MVAGNAILKQIFFVLTYALMHICACMQLWNKKVHRAKIQKFFLKTYAVMHICTYQNISINLNTMEVLYEKI